MTCLDVESLEVHLLDAVSCQLPGYGDCHGLVTDKVVFQQVHPCKVFDVLESPFVGGTAGLSFLVDIALYDAGLRVVIEYVFWRDVLVGPLSSSRHVVQGDELAVQYVGLWAYRAGRVRLVGNFL